MMYIYIYIYIYRLFPFDIIRIHEDPRSRLYLPHSKVSGIGHDHDSIIKVRF